MKKIYFLAFTSLLTLNTACRNNDEPPSQPTENLTPTSNKVLILKVDYLTNQFEGGTVVDFGPYTSAFNVTKSYQPPLDFGSLELTYQDVSQTLFKGSIIWMGVGQMDYPNNLQAASTFAQTTSPTIVYPVGYDNLHESPDPNSNFTTAWQNIQKLELVRDFLQTNPTQNVKYFLYTPSLGVGNPAEWDWMVYIKN